MVYTFQVTTFFQSMYTLYIITNCLYALYIIANIDLHIDLYQVDVFLPVHDKVILKPDKNRGNFSKRVRNSRETSWQNQKPCDY